ncbi:hypothetical protein T12_12845 [Trichinella patagoniensis]|uniref:Uncharacterized protein n=1 Tax=Trichinella patagoniensis TaxID=990121 RepID=A0A0V1AA59_9BILA|nr:hypothetical protein T12_12845 [Trichinella patagoniensis]
MYFKKCKANNLQTLLLRDDSGSDEILKISIITKMISKEINKCLRVIESFTHEMGHYDEILL